MAEQWLPVKGYEGLYEVSDHGRVKGLERCVHRKNGTDLKVPGRLMQQHLDQHGYLFVSLTKTRGGTKSLKVHRLVMQAFVGPHRGLQVRHLDGDSTNNRLSNLLYGTCEENAADKRVHNTDPRGERNAAARLTEQQVKFARAAYKRGQASLSLLAKAWGVHYNTVYHAVKGVYWGWL